MEMPDAGRHIERLQAEHREDLQIFGAYRMSATPRLNGSGNGASTTIFGCGSAVERRRWTSTERLPQR